MMLSLFLDNRRKCVLRDVIAVKNEFIFLRGFRLQSDSNNEAKTLTASKSHQSTEKGACCMYISCIKCDFAFADDQISAFTLMSQQEWATGQTDAEDVKYTLVTKHLSWRRSFISTAT